MLGLWKPSMLLSIKALRQRCLPLGVVLSLIYWDPGPSPVGEMMMTVGGVRGASETPIICLRVSGSGHSSRSQITIFSGIILGISLPSVRWYWVGMDMRE